MSVQRSFCVVNGRKRLTQKSFLTLSQEVLSWMNSQEKNSGWKNTADMRLESSIPFLQ